MSRRVFRMTFTSVAGAPGAPAISGFNLVVPNECEDALGNGKPAGNPVTQFDGFLAREVRLIQNYINTYGGLLIVTLGEGITSSPVRAVKFGNGGNVAFAAWGPPGPPRRIHRGAVHPLQLPAHDPGRLRSHPARVQLPGAAGNPATVPINQIWN
jgi:hypothetical protein